MAACLAWVLYWIGKADTIQCSSQLIIGVPSKESTGSGEEWKGKEGENWTCPLQKYGIV